MRNTKPTIEVIPEKSKSVGGKEQTIDVLVRIIPPEAEIDEAIRPKLNIALALDRSGSMQGEKMSQAREAAKYCIDQMHSGDRFSTVIFDDQVDVLYTSQPVSDRAMLKRGIDRITARNSTALHDGWVVAGLQVSENLDPTAINRVLLITDGQANVGETNPERIVEHSRLVSSKGVTTSTIGIGDDFNEDLLLRMAEAGQGNAWHVQEPADMVNIFETELRGLVKQFGHSVKLSLTTFDGVKITDVLNDFERDSTGRYELPNLLAGSPLEVVFRLQIPAVAVGTTESIAELKIEYIEQTSGDENVCRAFVKVSFDTSEIVSQLPRNVKVAESVQLLMNARARKEMMEHMDDGDFAFAAETLKSVMAHTDILYSMAPSPALAVERDELHSLNEMVADRSNDLMARKRMAYRRESIRKGKQ